jgi:hypothetical protein
LVQEGKRLCANGGGIWTAAILCAGGGSAGSGQAPEIFSHFLLDFSRASPHNPRNRSISALSRTRREITMRIGMILLSAVAILCFYASQGWAIDDIDPANPPQGFWNNMPTATFNKLDFAGNFEQFVSPLAFVSTKLIDSHDKDGTGTLQPHTHVQKEYDSIQGANSYWDLRFGASDTPPKTNRTADASTECNCYVVALNYIGKGSYQYWIDQNAQAADNAMNADTVGVVSTQVRPLDALYYKSSDHASVVIKVGSENTAGGAPFFPTQIRFKNNSSGNYDYLWMGFNTPMYTGPDPTVGKPPTTSTWTWTFDALGGFQNLDPDGQVRRKRN